MEAPITYSGDQSRVLFLRSPCSVVYLQRNITPVYYIGKKSVVASVTVDATSCSRVHNTELLYDDLSGRQDDYQQLDDAQKTYFGFYLILLPKLVTIHNYLSHIPTTYIGYWVNGKTLPQDVALSRTKIELCSQLRHHLSTEGPESIVHDLLARMTDIEKMADLFACIQQTLTQLTSKLGLSLFVRSVEGSPRGLRICETSPLVSYSNWRAMYVQGVTVEEIHMRSLDGVTSVALPPHTFVEYLVCHKTCVVVALRGTHKTMTVQFGSVLYRDSSLPPIRLRDDVVVGNESVLNKLSADCFVKLLQLLANESRSGGVPRSPESFKQEAFGLNPSSDATQDAKCVAAAYAELGRLVIPSVMQERLDGKSCSYLPRLERLHRNTAVTGGDSSTSVRQTAAPLGDIAMAVQAYYSIQTRNICTRLPDVSSLRHMRLQIDNFMFSAAVESTTAASTKQLETFMHELLNACDEAVLGLLCEKAEHLLLSLLDRSAATIKTAVRDVTHLNFQNCWESAVVKYVLSKTCSLATLLECPRDDLEAIAKYAVVVRLSTPELSFDIDEVGSFRRFDPDLYDPIDVSIKKGCGCLILFPTATQRTHNNTVVIAKGVARPIVAQDVTVELWSPPTDDRSPCIEHL